MTWTLFGMSFCYIVFVGPIFFVSVLGIADETNLACFTPPRPATRLEKIKVKLVWEHFVKLSSGEIVVWMT